MIRRLLAASALAVATSLSAAPAVQAAPPLCFTEYDLLKVGASIRAYAYRTCDGQPPTPMGVSLQRRVPGTNQWSTVAQGVGEARFTCFGTGLRTYRHGKQNSLTITANCT
jgi:hypothetical protein